MQYLFYLKNIEVFHTKKNRGIPSNKGFRNPNGKLINIIYINSTLLFEDFTTLPYLQLSECNQFGYYPC